MILKSEKIRAFLSQKKNITAVYIIVIVGVMLLCLPSFFQNEENVNNETVFTESGISASDMEKILSEISGVGKCRVLITYESGREYIIAKDISRSRDEKRENIDEKNITLGSGNSEKPFILKENMPKVLGVIVVCRGGDSDKVKMQVTDAVSVLTGLSKNKIKVFKN